MSVLRRAALALLLALTLAPPRWPTAIPRATSWFRRHPRLHDERRDELDPSRRSSPTTAQQVSDAGLPIKVAVIGNKTDLGAVPQLWGKPQTYARFLGAELRFVYKDTLLVVMPQGFGINGPFPQARRRWRRSHGIDPRKDPTPEGLTDSADKALRALATADGQGHERRRGRRRPAAAADRRRRHGARRHRRRRARAAQRSQAALAQAGP